jgi:hypothetical protein
MAIRLALALLIWAIAAPALRAMNLTVIGDQLVMSGDVVGSEYDEAVDLLDRNPAIRTVILRNSHGGNVPVSYRLGRYFRDHGLTTAVSGFCISSCSRLFLGGKQRAFTDDYPPSATQVWLHGHYKSSGVLDANTMSEYGLRDYLIRMSDGHADPALIDRWIDVPYNNGGIHFFNPAQMTWRHASAFLCQGVPRGTSPKESILDCEAIPKTALDLGIVTTLDLIHGNDQAALRKTWTVPSPAGGFTPVTDSVALPFREIPSAMHGFARFLTALPPRVMAMTVDGAHIIWVSGGEGDRRDVLLHDCAERFATACALYAVDGQIGTAALQAVRSF